MRRSRLKIPVPVASCNDRAHLTLTAALAKGQGSNASDPKAWPVLQSHAGLRGTLRIAEGRFDFLLLLVAIARRATLLLTLS